MKYIALFILVACSVQDQCYQNNYQTLKRYELDFSMRTVGGILADPTGQDVDLDRIDQLTNELESCLGAPIHRECIGVKIPNDWLISPCSGEQVLPIEAPDELCRAKGVVSTPLCPCRWRVALMDNHIIITTPNLKLYKAELARLVTGENDIWHSQFKPCL